MNILLLCNYCLKGQRKQVTVDVSIYTFYIHITYRFHMLLLLFQKLCD